MELLAALYRTDKRGRVGLSAQLRPSGLFLVLEDVVHGLRLKFLVVIGRVVPFLEQYREKVGRQRGEEKRAVS